MTPAPTNRKVWIFSDLHIGLEVDGKDGAEWAEIGIRDMLENVGSPDYILLLGDITHRFQTDQFEKYRQIRKHSGIHSWYEIPGNHDYRGVLSGDYSRLVRPELRYALLDGNLLWILFGAECSNAVGVVKSATRAWLEETVQAHRDKNIIVCSHQLVANTVRRTNPKEQYWRVLHPLRWVEEFRTEYRIDVWLAGHEHGPKRDRNMIITKDGTVFMNVSSISHVYGTKASNSFVFDMTAGQQTVHARCRNHDLRRYEEEHSATITLPFPLTFGHPRLIEMGSRE